MATFGWSYKSNVSGARTPKDQARKVEDWQKNRDLPKAPLHRQSHSSESLYAGMKRRRYNPRAKVFVGNLNKDTKPVTLAEFLSYFGEIASLKIIKDHETGISRGFAFVTFVEPEAADKAIRWCKHHHPRLDDKPLTISGAERRRPRKEVDPRKLSVKERTSGQTLYWEYKWQQGDKTEVFGPYETSLMLEWSKAGFFNVGCWVRQTDPHVDKQSEETDTNETEAKRPKLVVTYSDSSSSEDEESSLNANGRDGVRLDDKVAENSNERKIDCNNENPERTINEAAESNTNIKATGSFSNSFENEKTELEISSSEGAGQCPSAGNSDTDDSSKEEDAGSAADACYASADYGAYRSRDMLGRDSSSDDEDYYPAYSVSHVENEFVHISEIDFSLFP